MTTELIRKHLLPVLRELVECFELVKKSGLHVFLFMIFQSVLKAIFLSAHVYVLLARMNFRFYFYSHGFFKFLCESLLILMSQVCMLKSFDTLKLCGCFLRTDGVHPLDLHVDLCLNSVIYSDRTRQLFKLNT